VPDPGRRRTLGGSATSSEVLAILASLIADGELEVPIATAYPLADVQDAYRELGQGHVRGKIVLVP